ncbi:hypothetical protein U1Q18_033592 [Sarracenia purpurea var. burkii]
MDHESPCSSPPSPSVGPKTGNKSIVKSLYKALARGNLEMAAKLLVSSKAELEWWYHGPPNCQHMMLMLTGKPSHSEFGFKPRTITSVGELVIVEGWTVKAYWVHVWTSKDGKIAQFREYFDTWLTVLLQVLPPENIKLWQSHPQQRHHRSLPDLVLTV